MTSDEEEFDPRSLEALRPGASNPDDWEEPAPTPNDPETYITSRVRDRLESEQETEEIRGDSTNYETIGAQEELHRERARYERQGDYVYKFPTCVEPGCTKGLVFY
ncbi:MAG: hypothetical protein ACRDZM_17455, partial [Acidimicrobiia bacterium]